MKKLNLKHLKLDANDLLQREQLKSVLGGYGDWNKCCWDGTNNCGECGIGTVCVDGSYLKAC